MTACPIGPITSPCLCNPCILHFFLNYNSLAFWLCYSSLPISIMGATLSTTLASLPPLDDVFPPTPAVYSALVAGFQWFPAVSKQTQTHQKTPN